MATTCLICFDSEGELMQVPCSHCKTFVHGECLVMWMVRGGSCSCPVCRRVIVADPRTFGPVVLEGEVMETVLRAGGMHVPTTMFEFAWLLLSLTASVCMPWFFFFTDVIVSFTGFMHLYAGFPMPESIVSCLTCSVLIHLAISVLSLTNITRVMRRRLSLTLSLCAVLLALSTVTSLSSEMMGFVNEIMSTQMNMQSNLVRLEDLGSLQHMASSPWSSLASLGYLGMTYVLMFFMTIPAMIHNRSIWKVNYLCERITFVCIMAGMRSVGDARVLLALTSFTGILTSGVTFATG